MYDQSHPLSFNTRKALCLQLGESAGREVADVLEHLASRLSHLERTKVDVIPLIPGGTGGEKNLKIAG